MERLTDRRFAQDSFFISTDLEERKEVQFMMKPTYKQLYDRLSAYEDTGLEPEEVEGVRCGAILWRDAFIHEKEKREHDTQVAEEIEALGLSPDRLRELAQADKEGRCIVLPTKSINARYDVADMLEDFKEEAEFVGLSIGIFGITWAESEILQSIINALNLGREVDEKH